MSDLKYIERVAIVGATGRIGRHFAESIVSNGKQTVTGLTREGSKGKVPDGVKPVAVNYEDEDAMISVLRDQQLLIITLPVRAPPDLESKIITAAAKAKVPFIMPNAFGVDSSDPALANDLERLRVVPRHRVEIQNQGSSSMVLVCGFWFEWSLVLGEAWFGFDLAKKQVTFFDDGNTRISISTWNQCGRAIAALLRLPIAGQSPSISDWANKSVYIDSFTASQRDILDSIHRVTGSTDADWEIRHEGSSKRYEDGRAEVAQGNMLGRAKMLYSRVFYPDGSGDHTSKGLANETLGLPKENLDVLTKDVLTAVANGWNPLAEGTSL